MGAALAKELQVVFTDDAAIKDPEAAGFAELRFDGVENVFERGPIQTIAGKEFVAERKAFERDDQRQDQLFAIGPMIARVTALGLGHGLDVALKISAGQIVEQQIEGRAEEILPLLREVLFQGGLVRGDPIQAAIEPILLGHARVGVEQQVHGGLRKPFFVDGKFAARGDETIDGEKLDHFFPGHLACILGERIAPEGIQAQVAPELCGGPAIPEAARGLDSEGREFDLDHVGIVGRGLLTIGEEAELTVLAILVQDVNGVLPGIELGGVELAQVKDLALEDAMAVDAQTFADGVVGVRLAVFGAGAAFEKHDAGNLPRPGGGKTRGQVGTQAFWRIPPLSFKDLSEKI
mgnify:CR=1 FL=1